MATKRSHKTAKKATKRAKSPAKPATPAAVQATLAEQTADDMMPSRDRAREVAVQLTSNAATLAELSHRVIRIAGRLEGLTEAVESDQSNRMLESYRDGTMGESMTDLVQTALQIAARESEVQS